MAEVPLFVKIDDYKDVLDVVNVVRSRIDDAKKTLNRINELRNEEDAELDLWQSAVEEIERKAEFIDKSLFEPETL